MRVRSATAAELQTMVDWAGREGWNPGPVDAACFRVADPEGFLVGEVDGALAACISVVRYSERYGFLGFYICDPRFRGQGHGWAIWQAGMARLAGRTVGLDGVIAQQPNYRKSDFALAHRNVRYAGRVASPPAPSLPAIPVAVAHLAAIRAYDAPLFGAPRAAFLDAWLTARGHVARCVVEDGKLRGYGVLRPCREGFKLAPLFADTPAIAEALFASLAGETAGATIMLDLPEPNAEAVALALRHGLAPSFETARMYRGPAPALPLDRIFGLTSFELG